MSQNHATAEHFWFLESGRIPRPRKRRDINNQVARNALTLA